MERSAHSRADLVAAITGVAGPGGGTPDKPVGLVYVVAAGKRSRPKLSRLLLDNLDRHGIRARSVLEAMRLLKAQAATLAAPLVHAAAVSCLFSLRRMSHWAISSSEKDDQ